MGNTGILRKWDVIRTQERSKREYQFNIYNNMKSLDLHNMLIK